MDNSQDTVMWTELTLMSLGCYGQDSGHFRDELVDIGQVLDQPRLFGFSFRDPVSEGGHH